MDTQEDFLMSVVLMEGFDYYSSFTAMTPTMTLSSHWIFDTASPPSQIDVAVGRFDGSQALYMNRTGSGLDHASVLVNNTSTQYTIGFAQKQVTMPSAEHLWLSLYEIASPSSANLDFYLSSTGIITAKAGATILGTSTSAITTDWQYVEISISADNAAGSISILIDGATKLTLTGIDTISIGTGVMNKLQFTCSTLSTYYVDDMYITSNTTPLGDSRVTVLAPSADAGFTDWTLSPPSLPNHYSAVNGTIPDYSTYVYTNIPGNRDLYDYSDMVFNPVSVYAIQPIFAARKDTSANKNIRMDIVTNAGTYFDISQTVPVSTTTFYRVEGSIIETNPVTAIAWSVMDLNGIQMGPEIA